MAAYVSLENAELFHSWNSLPSNTAKHFCFLAEIQNREGDLCVVAFYLDSYEGLDFKQLKRGHTLAITSPIEHNFADGADGVMVDNMDGVCVFPTGPEALRGLVPDVATYAVGKEWVCRGCEASRPIEEMNRCGQCKVYAYCSKVCQAKGWTEKGHKLTCNVLRGPNFLPLLELDFASGPTSNPFAFQRL